MEYLWRNHIIPEITFGIYKNFLKHWKATGKKWYLSACPSPNNFYHVLENKCLDLNIPNFFFSPKWLFSWFHFAQVRN